MSSTCLSTVIIAIGCRGGKKWDSQLGHGIIMDFDHGKPRLVASTLSSICIQVGAAANWPDGRRITALGVSAFDPSHAHGHDVKRGAVIDMSIGGVVGALPTTTHKLFTSAIYVMLPRTIIARELAPRKAQGLGNQFCLPRDNVGTAGPGRAGASSASPSDDQARKNRLRCCLICPDRPDASRAFGAIPRFYIGTAWSFLC